MSLHLVGVQTQPLEPAVFDADVVVIVDDVKADDLIAARDEPLGQVVADETGGAGDENLHA
jgi:hypothetical protein